MTQQDKDQIVRLLRLRWSSSRIPELAQGVYDAIEIVEAMPVSANEAAMQAALSAVLEWYDNCGGPRQEDEAIEAARSAIANATREAVTA